ncbi:hypothetical protein EVAR_36565_1 [Eumeta japonica]|uniref:Uncharacterized protein n=1 Tax=Eumeta variegata TaxID=151549 RepID=A0A4C1Y086_EUMVA|nr:hypothetical protein EVAR_36565_1 [Eumeta japonica]
MSRTALLLFSVVTVAGLPYAARLMQPGPVAPRCISHINRPAGSVTGASRRLAIPNAQRAVSLLGGYCAEVPLANRFSIVYV